MKTLYIDAGYLIAVEASDDQNHQIAFSHWQKLIQQPLQLITTTYIFDEIVTFFNNRNRHSKAVEIGQNLLQSEVVNMVHVDEQLLNAGWNYFQKHSDKRYSLTDCISFILMEQMKLDTALSFDRHFVQAGFINLPIK